MSQVTIAPSKDNTLFEDGGGALSNGAGPYIFAGSTGTNAGFVLRRAAIAFDVTGSVPAGATVTGATFTLNVSRQPAGPVIPTTIELHRLLVDWGEGTSNSGTTRGGTGATSTTGDATWIHTFYNTENWTNPGGDYSAAISGSQSVAGLGPRSWTGPQIIADVQSWLDDASNNLGWIIIGDEAPMKTARRFDSREHATMSVRPQLTITYVK